MLTSREFYNQTLKTAKIQRLSDLETADIINFIHHVGQKLNTNSIIPDIIDHNSDTYVYLNSGINHLNNIDGWSKKFSSSTQIDELLEKTKIWKMSPIATLGFLMWFASMGGSPHRLEIALKEPHIHPNDLIREINDLSCSVPPEKKAEKYVSEFYESSNV